MHQLMTTEKGMNEVYSVDKKVKGILSFQAIFQTKNGHQKKKKSSNKLKALNDNPTFRLTSDKFQNKN